MFIRDKIENQVGSPFRSLRNKVYGISTPAGPSIPAPATWPWTVRHHGSYTPSQIRWTATPGTTINVRIEKISNGDFVEVNGTATGGLDTVGLSFVLPPYTLEPLYVTVTISDYSAVTYFNWFADYEFEEALFPDMTGFTSMAHLDFDFGVNPAYGGQNSGWVQGLASLPIDYFYCKLPVVGWEPISVPLGLTQFLINGDLTQESYNQVFIDFDDSGVPISIMNMRQANAGFDPSPVYPTDAGLTAYNNLIGKGFLITLDP